ncbi:MAG: 6-phosphogluconolactonase, partial [Prolixibacteraceae bacterium]|nr:6-phosphogluconolactonase [Prolixibacteraceae bacterium]
MIKSFQKDRLNVEIYDSVDEMGKASAIKAAGLLNKAIVEKGEANLILATGASQFSFYKHLQKQKIDWQKITVFHLDEYK